MPVIPTHEITQSTQSTSMDQIYNGMDCCLTFEIFEALTALTNDEPTIYQFERALQGPALEMMLRGFKIDPLERSAGIAQTTDTLARLNAILQTYAHAVWDKPLNPRSTLQLQRFFYGRMGLPQVWTMDKGERKLSMNRDSLEKLENYFLAMPIIAVILAIRDYDKQLQVLESEIDPDGRFRTSINIAGTETGRWSSSKSQTGTGGNGQNITPRLRRMFEADPGMRLYGIDLEQAESREVGWICGALFDEWAYYDACLAGDLHTTTCKLIWPKLAWTGDPKADKALAESPFYRHYSHRDMSKRGGHGCLTPDHEVLTPGGWEPIWKKPGVILAYDPASNGSTFQPVQNWIDKQSEPGLIQWKGQSLSAIMTPEHKILNLSAPRAAPRTAADGPPRRVFLGEGFQGGGVKDFDPALAALIHIRAEQANDETLKIRCHSAKSLTVAQDILKSAGIPYTTPFRTATSGQVFFRRDAITLPLTPGAYQFQWDKLKLHMYLIWLRKIRPYKTGTRSGYAVRNLQDGEWFITLQRIMGIGGTIVHHRGRPRSPEGQVLVTYSNTQFTQGPSIKVTHLAHSERVFCPTVHSGWFYVRHGGKIHVTGNSNYYGKPFTMARHLKVPTRLMQDFQGAYFDAYPGIHRWHQWTATELQTRQCITTKFGRTRYFFGRSNDDTTLREAIAFDPQSCTADRMNLILWRLWKYMPQIQILLQVHDAVYFQAPEELDPETVAAEALSHFHIDISHPSGRKLIVPGEAKWGWNWANYADQKDIDSALKAGRKPPKLNPNGLKKLGGAPRTRATGLMRVL